MRLEATNKNVRGGAKLAPLPSQVGLSLCLCQKPHLQKLCALPPKIFFNEVHFGSEKNLGLKICLGRTKFCV